VFVAHGGGERQLARARGWQSLLVREGEREHFDHSPEWAAQVHARLLTALNARASRPAAPNASAVHDARLFVVSDGESAAVWPHPGPPAGIATAQEYCFTSDLQRAASDTVTVQPKSHMVNDRNEARFLASAESRGKWFGISKIILTMFTGQGKDVLVAGVPPEIVGILRLTCPDLIVVAPDDVSRRAS
jgi:hypothetical protein